MSRAQHIIHLCNILSISCKQSSILAILHRPNTNYRAWHQSMRALYVLPAVGREGGRLHGSTTCRALLTCCARSLSCTAAARPVATSASSSVPVHCCISASCFMVAPVLGRGGGPCDAYVLDLPFAVLITRLIKRGGRGAAHCCCCCNCSILGYLLFKKASASARNAREPPHVIL